jgi:hypothetical protein
MTNARRISDTAIAGSPIHYKHCTLVGQTDRKTEERPQTASFLHWHSKGGVRQYGLPMSRNDSILKKGGQDGHLEFYSTETLCDSILLNRKLNLRDVTRGICIGFMIGIVV